MGSRQAGHSGSAGENYTDVLGPNGGTSAYAVQHIRYPLSAIRYPLSAIRYPLNVLFGMNTYSRGYAVGVLSRSRRGMLGRGGSDGLP
ncbi:MAG TPA: hypothetical protein PK461_01400 [Alcaligenes faecalis]|nr:hypothetical protein [Alcaligenes faecalis]